MTHRSASSFLALSPSTARRQALRAGAALLAVALLPAAGAAESELAVGSALPPLSVNDQFDRPVVVDAGTRLVLFAADKAAGDVATEALKAHPDVLAQQRLVYVADISGMPAVITRMFALPKMRDLPFPVGLVRDAQLTAALPRKAGMLTLMVLEGGTVRGIEYLPDAAAVRSRLGIAS
ncbi:hypothetical protein [Pseudacidovorax intermedius]|uniref:hypothetical protein n=1 Tax=Pseudacidovorax intermedius TaxID=433924 RepID=UPI000344A72E|nr:hypothetical protein [Pseudacidovorax intermedius]